MNDTAVRCEPRPGLRRSPLIIVEGVPPSEPAWWRATCRCGLTATSRAGPYDACDLLDAEHRKATA